MHSLSSVLGLQPGGPATGFPAVTSSIVRLQSGTRLRCLEQGTPEGDPVLLLHGWSDSSFSFTPVLPLLPSGVRAIVPDQRGHGDSDRPLLGYTMTDLALDALDLLDAFQITRATVVGHSMGGFVAQHMAVLAPERVGKLVLVATAADPRTDVVGSMREMVDAIEDPVDTLFIRNFQAGTIHRIVPDQFFETVVSESQKLPARVWKSLYRGFMNTAPPDLDGVRCPVRILWGDQDAVFSRTDQDLLVERLPGAALTVLPGIGHAVHWESPEALATVLG
jgi:non-heme chloroperoxidase